jgi:hypothetical protein
MQPHGTERAPVSSGAGGLGTGDGLNLRPGSRGTGDGRRASGRRWSPWLTLLLVGVLAAAVAFARMSAAGAIAAAVFGGSALFFAESLVRSLDGGERASFESAWGGLGGGLGGWRLTAPLVYLIATAVFATLLLVVAVHEMSPVDQAGTEAVGPGEAGAGESGAGEGDVDESGAGEPVGDTDADETDAGGADADETEAGETGESIAGGEPAAQP